MEKISTPRTQCLIVALLNAVSPWKVGKFLGPVFPKSPEPIWDWVSGNSGVEIPCSDCDNWKKFGKFWPPNCRFVGLSAPFCRFRLWIPWRIESAEGKLRCSGSGNWNPDEMLKNFFRFLKIYVFKFWVFGFLFKKNHCIVWNVKILVCFNVFIPFLII